MWTSFVIFEFFKKYKHFSKLEHFNFLSIFLKIFCDHFCRFEKHEYAVKFYEKYSKVWTYLELKWHLLKTKREEKNVLGNTNWPSHLCSLTPSFSFVDSYEGLYITSSKVDDALAWFTTKWSSPEREERCLSSSLFSFFFIFVYIY